MGEHVPVFDMADRLRKSLRDAEVGVQQMADYLGVARNTVSNWINGHNPPGNPELRLWALRTGVPLPWLKSGEAPTEAPSHLTTRQKWADKGASFERGAA